MDSTVFLSMSNQSALRRRMDIVANNIANMNTTAYKRERVVFRQELVDAENAQATVGGKLSYVLDHGIVRNLDQGTMLPTNNPLDLFIDGPGYLPVQAQDGETYYTRAGRFQLDPEGFLVTPAGARLLDDGGDAIQLAEGDTDIQTDEDGTITGRLGQIARLQVVTFPDEQNLRRRGNNLYETEQAPQPIGDPTQSKIIDRAIEGSNVNTIETMVEMIRVLRSYQGASKNSSEVQDLGEEAIERLGRVR